MAERTIRRNKRGNSATVVRASDDVTTVNGNSIADGEPVAIQPDGTVEPTTIDDYIVDQPDNGIGDTFVDPNTGSSSGTGSGNGRRTRSDTGKPRGRRSSRTSASETTSSVANLLFSVHLGIANLFGSEVFAITPEESQALAKAVTNVSQYYDVPIVSEKALAWVNLATTLGAVYGPRFVAAKMRKTKKPNVVTFEQSTTRYNPPHQPITVEDAYQESKNAV